MVGASCYFGWGQLTVVGLACDIAGVLMLAMSFMTKTPAAIRSEVPKVVAGMAGFGEGPFSVPFPQASRRACAGGEPRRSQAVRFSRSASRCR